ncbi:hypothetical protein IQ264_04055 [Phormidium sp. LEGE 05292]|uniref:DUF7219 family protein n=1 Tax=[Phormidium] sp. LEGE 05292 TaxID=767427 RepID=UPI00188047EC|nr:hypothetical protein [Phormidium sp. LEGE 05292]MBE9224644.1 hypothetical protein [Phormidium sp. LEGE 05292]
MSTKNELLYARSRYHGKITPDHLVFNANLQEFAQRTNYITSLETNGKISREEAYQKIEDLWQQFELIYQQLEIAS